MERPLSEIDGHVKEEGHLSLTTRCTPAQPLRGVECGHPNKWGRVLGTPAPWHRGGELHRRAGNATKRRLLAQSLSRRLQRQEEPMASQDT